MSDKIDTSNYESNKSQIMNKINPFFFLSKEELH